MSAADQRGLGQGDGGRQEVRPQVPASSPGSAPALALAPTCRGGEAARARGHRPGRVHHREEEQLPPAVSQEEELPAVHDLSQRRPQDGGH